MSDTTSRIREKIQADLDERREFKTADILIAFPGHEKLVRYVVGQMLKGREILKIGKTRAAYYVPGTKKNAQALVHEASSWKKTYPNTGTSEADVYDAVVAEMPKLGLLHENVKSIFDYAFSEMVNNAIDHSGSDTIDVTVNVGDGKLIFTVEDAGIGVFENVKRKRGLASHYEAALDVLKGKTTTAPDRHSGEGIFFTSKAADVFVLESQGLRLTVDNRIPDTFLEEIAVRAGTRVRFEISLNSTRHLNKDVFMPYSLDLEEPAFDKTVIHVKLYKYGTAQISRSQAHRLLAGLEKFKKIVLDFERVPSVGQAFADEVFRVFQKRHQDISLEYMNANEAVRYMIERAKRNQS